VPAASGAPRARWRAHDGLAQGQPGSSERRLFAAVRAPLELTPNRLAPSRARPVQVGERSTVRCQLKTSQSGLRALFTADANQGEAA
jgi:hypothetical protein